jgi:hypothetical protein
VYRTIGWNSTWSTFPATYAAPTDGNFEAWEWKISLSPYVTRNISQIEFYVEYIVNGTRYVDDNNASYYHVGGGPYAPQALLNKPAVKLGVLNFSYDNLVGHVYLKNLAYHKDVKLVYTTDSWASVKTAPLNYSSTLDHTNGYLEIWDFKVPVSTDVKKVEAAVMYTVDGVTYWDTNYNNRNYIIQR